MNFDKEKQNLMNTILNRPNERWVVSNIIFATIHGSTAYGLNTETSDLDISGIMVAPRDYYLGFMKNCEQLQYSKPDGTVYNIKKFFALAADNNPNVMELLWIDEKYWIYHTKVFELLVENRDLFLSKKVRYTYAGYAHAQLKRIKTHKRWLIEPPTHKPTREEFNLAPQRIISKDQQGALNNLMEKDKVDLGENYMELLRKENLYDKAKQEWDQYQNWKNTRNEARAELEAKYGYDTKHAAHLVRLIRQCKEMLKKQTLAVERPDREELLSIRRGAWTYDLLMEWVETECSDEVLDALYISSELKKEPAREQLHKLCSELIYDFIK